MFDCTYKIIYMYCLYIFYFSLNKDIKIYFYNNLLKFHKNTKKINIFKIVFMSFLYFLDLFKVPVFLRIDKNEKHSTFLGQIISILIISYLIFSFTTGEFIYRIHPSIVDQPFTGESRPRISLSSKNFALSVAVTDVTSKAIVDPTIFKIDLYYEELVSLSNETGKNISFIDLKTLHLCNESDYPEDPTIFQTLGLKNYMCLDNSTLELQGYWDEPKLSYFFLILSTCQNRSDSNIICKPQEEIENFFENKYFQIYYKDINYDLNDYDKPVKSLFKTEYTMVDFYVRKKMTMFFKKLEIIDDKNYIFEDNNPKDLFKKDETFLDVDSNRDKKSQILAFMFYPTLEIQKASRRFQKLKEVISSLGGSASFFIMIGFFFVNYQNQIKITNKIMNQLYAFQGLDKKNNVSTNKAKEIPQFILENLQTIKKETNFVKPPAKLSKEINIKNQNLRGPDIPAKILVDDYVDSEKSIAKNENSGDGLKKSTTNKKTSTASKNNDNVLVKSGSIRKFASNIFKRKKNPNILQLNEYSEALTHENNINISVFQAIKLNISKFFGCAMSSKEKLINKACNIFSEELDLVSILKRLQEMEKLKIILLNEKQLCLFNLLAKPMIYVESETDIKEIHSGLKLFNLLKLKDDKKENNENHKKTLRIYEEMITSDKLSEIDERILNLIDKNLEKFSLQK